MATYWLTFRIHDDATYETRYADLMAAVQQAVTGKHWAETTSFVMFESTHSIDAIASHLAKSIAPSKDLLLLGMNEVKSARVIGKVADQDLFVLMPFVK